MPRVERSPSRHLRLIPALSRPFGRSNQDIIIPYPNFFLCSSIIFPLSCVVGRSVVFHGRCFLSPFRAKRTATATTTQGGPSLSHSHFVLCLLPPTRLLLLFPPPAPPQTGYLTAVRRRGADQYQIHTYTHTPDDDGDEPFPHLYGRGSAFYSFSKKCCQKRNCSEFKLEICDEYIMP